MRLLPIAAAIGLALFAGSTLAAPINAVNPRQSLVNAPPAGEASLQHILTGGSSFPFTGVFQGASINAATDQSRFGMFNSATDPVTFAPTLVAEYSANSGTQTFGIWFGTDTTNIVQFDLFTGGAVRNSVASISIDEGSMEVFGSNNPGSVSACGTKVVCNSYVDALISPTSAFGFYFKSTGSGQTYYTVDQLNAGPHSDRVLAYTNGSTTNWAFAFDDDSNRDYNDMVVKVEALTPVPEPSTYAMLGVGLLGMGFGLARNRRTRK